MSEFHVVGVFSESFRQRPLVVGTLIGDLDIGQRVELHKKNGLKYYGVLDSVEIHQSHSGERSLMFSDEISSHVEPGDVICSLETGSQ